MIGMMRKMVNGLHQPFLTPSTRAHGNKRFLSKLIKKYNRIFISLLFFFLTFLF